jgi:hypothetical protein
MKIVVSALGGVLLLLVAVVLSTLVLRIVKGGPPAKPPAAAGILPPVLPAGAKILSTSLGEGRLAVVYEAQGRQGILMFDAATLAPLGRIEPSQ